MKTLLLCLVSITAFQTQASTKYETKLKLIKKYRPSVEFTGNYFTLGKCTFNVKRGVFLEDGDLHSDTKYHFKKCEKDEQLMSVKEYVNGVKPTCLIDGEEIAGLNEAYLKRFGNDGRACWEGVAKIVKLEDLEQ
jgi:hypothetical protein